MIGKHCTVTSCFLLDRPLPEANPYGGLVAISRESDALLALIQNSWRRIYSKQADFRVKNPMFVVAFQNAFEMILAYVTSLSQLGRVLQQMRAYEIMVSA
jgi:hypothetical protein